MKFAILCLAALSFSASAIAAPEKKSFERPMVLETGKIPRLMFFRNDGEPMTEEQIQSSANFGHALSDLCATQLAAKLSTTPAEFKQSIATNPERLIGWNGCLNSVFRDWEQEGKIPLGLNAILATSDSN